MDAEVRSKADELLEALSAIGEAGEPLELEDKVVIPLAEVAMGLVAKRGGCGGLRLDPASVVVVLKGVSGPDGIKVFSLAPGPISESGGFIASLIESLQGRDEWHGSTPDVK